jgi:cell division protein FtsW (lipid II flippase)
MHKVKGVGADSADGRDPIRGSINKKEKKMKMRQIVKWGLCAVSVALSIMGLCFAWRCPLDCVFGEDSGVFLFKRQLLWNAVGIAACIGAAVVPWRRWIKFAPLGMLAWLVLAGWAIGFSPVRHGTHRWADLGFISVNVHLVLVLAWALFTAWLCSKKCVKPWMVFAFIGVLLVAAGVNVLGNANRLARIGAFFGASDGNAHYAYMQLQMKAAYAAADWFGDADRSLLYLPVAYAVAMPSASALLFCKCFTIAVAALFAVFGGLLTYLWFLIGNPSKRMFVLFWGGAVAFSAMYSFCQSVGLVPVLGLSPALAGCGGALAMTYWVGFGILLSILSDKDEGVATNMSHFHAIASGGAWFGLFILFMLGIAVASNSNQKFYATVPRAEVFGDIGICGESHCIGELE